MDEGSSIGWLTFLFEGGVIAFALWELYRLRRDCRRDAGPSAPRDPAPPDDGRG